MAKIEAENLSKSERGIAVYDTPMLKGVPLPGVYTGDEAGKRQYYTRLLKLEAGYHAEMINLCIVENPPFYVRWMEKLYLTSRESRRAKREKMLEKVLNTYMEKDKWLKRELLSEEAQGSLALEDMEKGREGIGVLIRKIEAEGFGVGVVNGNPCIYEVDRDSEGQAKSRMNDYFAQRRSELSGQLAALIKDSREGDSGDSLREINAQIGELRQAKMFVNAYIKSLKHALRDIKNGIVYRIDFSRVGTNAANV
jgi:hypothetical protein